MIVAAACATQQRPLAEPPGVNLTPATASTYDETTYDTTFYISSRARRSGRAVDSLADSLEYGLVVTRFRGRAGPGSDGRYLEGIDAEPVDSARFDRAEFAARLNVSDAAARTRGEGAILYVHGYGTSFHRAIAQGAEIAHRGAFAGPFVVYAWPANSSLVTWPTRSAIVSRAYRDDSVAAAANHAAFRAALSQLRAATSPGAMTLVAHSLGAQLSVEALVYASPERDSLIATPLRALVLFAPDIPAVRFRDSLAGPLAPLAARRVVYAASDDRMLGISRRINHSGRVGEIGAIRDLAARGIEVVDVTNGLHVNGPMRKLFEPNHAMRFSSSALHDFFALARGLPEKCRPALGTSERAGDGVWSLTNAPIPRDTIPSC